MKIPKFSMRSHLNEPYYVTIIPTIRDDEIYQDGRDWYDFYLHNYKTTKYLYMFTICCNTHEDAHELARKLGPTYIEEYERAKHDGERVFEL